MKMDDLKKWNTRMALVYALGVWSMIGSVAYLRHTGRLQVKPVKKEEEEKVQDPNLTTVVYENAYMKTVMTYRKDHVPYTDRIYNWFVYGSVGGRPGSGGSDK